MAIIVVLAAIAIPTFGRQLETARESNDAELIRAAATDAFSKAYAEFASSGTVPTGAFTGDSKAPFKQKTPAFSYMTPTITIGNAVATLSTIGEATKASEIQFTFAADGESIKIATITDSKTGTATTLTTSVTDLT